MSKLSEPVAKALQALLKACKGDTMVFMRTITGNYSAHEYFHDLQDEILLLRCANFDDILVALNSGLPKAIKTTEQPSAAAAVEGLEGILTEEELNKPVIIRITSHDGSNWYGDNDIGSYWEVVKECITTFQIKTDEPYRVGINKLHCEITSGSLPEKILSEKELKEYELLNNQLTIEFLEIKRLIYSNRHLLSANADLQMENERLTKTDVIITNHNNRMYKSLKDISESSTNLADSLKIQAYQTLEEFNL